MSNHLILPVLRWFHSTAPGYRYRGDKLTAPHLRNALCWAVRRADGRCIRGRNGNMLVQFAVGGQQVVLARQLRKQP